MGHKRHKNKWWKGFGRHNRKQGKRANYYSGGNMADDKDTKTKPKVKLPEPVTPKGQMWGAKNKDKVTFKSLRVPPKEPVVRLTLDVYNDIQAIIQNMEASMEVSWLCGVTFQEPNVYIVDTLYIPEQENAGATTEMTQQGVTDVYMKVLREKGVDEANRIKLWGHLHPWAGDSVIPSGQDEDQFQQFGRNRNEWFIRAIFNKDIVAKFDIINFKDGWRFDDIDWEIDLPAASTERVTGIRAELEAKVSHLYAPTTIGSGYNYRRDDEYYSDAEGYWNGGIFVKYNDHKGSTPIGKEPTIPTSDPVTVKWKHQW